MLIKSLRSLKKGTKFYTYGKDDKKIIAIAGTKRGPSREIKLEGRDETFNERSDIKVEVVQ